MDSVHISEGSKSRLRSKAKPILGAVIIVGLTLGTVEAALALIDPWGLRYFDNLYQLFSAYVVDDMRGYVLPDGEYPFTGWQARMVNGTRFVPDTNSQADCTIVMLGDSVTFGEGVDDVQTWVNQVARQVPQAHIINGGLVAYNSTNALGTLRALPQADGYLYYIVNNDLEESLDFRSVTPQPPPIRLWIMRYMSFAVYGANKTDGSVEATSAANDSSAAVVSHQKERFFNELDAMLASGHVTLVTASREALLNDLLTRGYAVNVIEWPGYVISRVDRHLNPQGNLALAAQISPIVNDMVSANCDTSE